jgi:formate hydrogenlyase subunit 3/multisubunit Na+/H+ antiporter MnhD subunit
MTLLYPILLPLAIGLVTLLYPKREFKSYLNPIYILSIITIAVSFAVSVLIFRLGNISYLFGVLPASDWSGPGISLDLVASRFSGFVLMAAMFFGLLIAIYSYRHLKKTYFTYLLWTISASALAILANNLVVLLLAWGAVAILLYLMIAQGKSGSAAAANKTLVMVGGSDILMLIGAALVYFHTRTVTMSEISISLNGALPIIAYILLLIGALTKAGAMPFHSWIPDSAESAPVSVMALLPASIDKLLGIYLLTRLSLDMFKVTSGSAMSVVLMVIGSITIIAAVSMALVQKNLLKLLSFHAVSQVGYMVLGIGTGNPIGIIGGVFHMINHALYKSNLFLSAGAVEARTGETKLAKLGGLARYMPITFTATFISAMAISGIPPLNGFASKWLVYQGLVQNSQTNGYSIFFLLVAMFGSVLTLASFLKVLHSVFLGEKPKELAKTKEAGLGMLVPMIILSVLCIGLGVFAQIPIRYLFNAVFGYEIAGLGFWNPGLATILMLAGVVIGVIVYLLSRTKKTRQADVFIGGELISAETSAVMTLPDGGQTMTSVIDINEAAVPGTAFYDSIKKVPLIDDTYRVADTKFFDVYEQLKKVTGIAIRAFKKLHDGLLHTYLGWIFLGTIAIMAAFLVAILK